jgi:dipeptidase E
MKLLLLSNSTNAGEEYLAYSKKIIFDFLSERREKIVFIPFAGITIDWDEYSDMVNKALGEIGMHVLPVHQQDDPYQAVAEASALMVGGGNSFHLLNQLYEYHLIELIRTKVLEGMPYVGWSAGANMACPTLKTTNDMPIVEPPSFKAFSLINFQINPHYTEEVLPNHGGESREMRIAEYTKANPDSRVVGLPEGTMLNITDHYIRILGERGCKFFKEGAVSRWILKDEELNELLNEQ